MPRGPLGEFRVLLLAAVGVAVITAGYAALGISNATIVALTFLMLVLVGEATVTKGTSASDGI